MISPEAADLCVRQEECAARMRRRRLVWRALYSVLFGCILLVAFDSARPAQLTFLDCVFFLPLIAFTPALSREHRMLLDRPAASGDPQSIPAMINALALTHPQDRSVRQNAKLGLTRLLPTSSCEAALAIPADKRRRLYERLNSRAPADFRLAVLKFATTIADPVAAPYVAALVRSRRYSKESPRMVQLAGDYLEHQRLLNSAGAARNSLLRMSCDVTADAELLVPTAGHGTAADAELVQASDSAVPSP